MDLALDALRELPEVDREAIARVVATAARLRAVDAGPNEDDLFPTPLAAERGSRTVVYAAAAAVLVLLGAGAAIWGLPRTTYDPNTAPPSAPGIPSSVVEASGSSDAMESVAVPTQFVYDGVAHRVALVGDFNGWDEHATPLVREPGSSLWSVTVPLARGRHVYAFIVDSKWTADRRAPTSRDPDFGVEGSVIIVGRP